MFRDEGAKSKTRLIDLHNKRTVPVRGSAAAGDSKTFSFSITDSPQAGPITSVICPDKLEEKTPVISHSFLARHSHHKSKIIENRSFPNLKMRSHD